MTTAKEIFNIAICLMDAQNESTGSTETADTREYQVRTPSLLNSILDRACPASDNWRTAEEGRRPVCPKVTDLTDPIDLDERICTGVLPYGRGKSNPGQFHLADLSGTAGGGKAGRALRSGGH